MKNNFIYVRAFIREGWISKDTGKKGDPRLQFNSFQLLHDVMDSMAKKLSIRLNINDLKEEKITTIKDLLSMHKGEHHLNFVVYDNDENIKLQMLSRKQKVKISQELLDELAEQDVHYKLN